MLEGLKLLAAAIDRRHPAWVLFSVLFGIAGPIVCVVVDDWSGFDVGGAAVNATIGIMIATLFVFVFARPSNAVGLGTIAGVLSFGTIVALSYAAALAPLSLSYLTADGSFLHDRTYSRILGVTGALPWFATLVFGLNAISALGCAIAARSRRTAGLAGALTFLLFPVATLGCELVVQAAEHRTALAILSGDRERAERAVLWTRPIAWCARWDRLERGVRTGRTRIDDRQVVCEDEALGREMYRALTGEWPRP